MVGPKVIGLDKPFDKLITLPVEEVGTDLKISPSNNTTSFKLIGKNARKLDKSLACLKVKTANIFDNLNITDQYTIEVKTNYHPSEPEILAALFEGMWKIARPDTIEKEVEAKLLTEQWKLNHWDKQLFYTSIAGGMRISQFPFQENGFRLNLPKGFRIVLFPRKLRIPLKPTAPQNLHAFRPDTRVLTAALATGCLYADISRIKFALSGSIVQTPFNVISYGRDCKNLASSSDENIINYTIFKNSTEADDFIKDLKKINETNRLVNKITMANLAIEGVRVL